MIYLAGISIAVFFEFLLISKKNKTEPDKILVLWMFLVTVHLFLFYISFIEEIYNYPFLLGVNLPLPLLHGVFLYLYVGSVTNQLPARKNILGIHFIPAIVTYLYLIAFFILPADQKILVFKNRGAGYEVFNTIRVIATGLSGIVYVTWSGLLLRKHRRRILDKFSYQEKIDLQWLRILTWGLGGIWLLIFVRDDTAVFGGAAVLVFLIGFFGIRQARIFAPEQVPVSEQEQKGKYAKSGLTRDLSEKLYQELIRLMNEEAIYRKNDLSADDLASRLKTHPNYLSQIINEKEGQNFYDFVNHYRVEEFKRIVANPNNLNVTLLSLAFDCGFNSKSSFNRYFKKATGQTPSEYFANLTKS